MADAHVEMLSACAIIPSEQAGAIRAGLADLGRQFADAGVPLDGGDEDIHSLVERLLHESIGAASGHLRTARSRNDQVATAFRLYVRAATVRVWLASLDLFDTIVDRAGQQNLAIAPGMTHLQVGQPILLAHHLLAHAQAIKRTCLRCPVAIEAASELPLGAGALAGTTFPIDPQLVASRLGFARVTANSIDAVANRDFVVDFLQVTAQLAVNLSRMAEEIVIWASQPYSAVALPAAWSTGSSIMPQKKNPDVAELVRGRAGAAIGRVAGFLATVKSLPLAYNLDLQEDKQVVFAAEDDALASLRALDGLLASLHFDQQRLREIAAMGSSAATDLADYLVTRGLPFSQAHAKVAGLVAELERTGGDLSKVGLAQLQAHSELFAADALDRMDPTWSVNARVSPGGTAPVQVLAQIQDAADWSASERVRATAATPGFLPK